MAENGGGEAKRRPGGRPKTARIEGGEGLLPWSWPASARPQVLLARPARRAGLGSSARVPRRVLAGTDFLPKDHPPPKASPSSRSAVSEAVVVCD